MRTAEIAELAKHITSKHPGYHDADWPTDEQLVDWINEYFSRGWTGARLHSATDYLANHLYHGLLDKRPQHRAPVDDHEKFEKLTIAFHLKDEFWSVSDTEFAKEYLEPTLGVIFREFREKYGHWRGIDFNDKVALPHPGTGTLGYIGHSNPVGVAVRGLEGYDGMAQAHVFTFTAFVKERN